MVRDLSSSSSLCRFPFAVAFSADTVAAVVATASVVAAVSVLQPSTRAAAPVSARICCPVHLLHVCK